MNSQLASGLRAPFMTLRRPNRPYAGIGFYTDFRYSHPPQ